MCFCCSVFGAKAQSDSLSVSSLKGSIKTQIVKLDDSTMSELYYIIEGKIQESIPRYKMYKTENVYILLKLDTATGRVWMVQYAMENNSSAKEIAIEDSFLTSDGENGRYELYPTNNMYTFILLDTKHGYTYQVQWNTEHNKRFIERIY